MITYRKVGDIYRIHETLGFKMDVIAQFRMHILIQPDVNLCGCLLNACYREIIK